MLDVNHRITHANLRECRDCGTEVKQTLGKRPKLYCSAKCKKRWQRKHKKTTAVKRDKPKLSRIEKPKLKCKCGGQCDITNELVWVAIGSVHARCSKCNLLSQFVRTTAGWVLI